MRPILPVLCFHRAQRVMVGSVAGDDFVERGEVSIRMDRRVRRNGITSTTAQFSLTSNGASLRKSPLFST
jgi:hypothetical protein